MKLSNEILLDIFVKLDELYYTLKINETRGKISSLNKYLSKVDKETITKGNKKRNKFDNISKLCEKCKDEMILDLHNGLMVCRICGESQTILVESDIPNYKEECNDTKTYVAYKTMNHFNEWLNKIQGKEVIELSEEVCDKIKKEIRVVAKKQRTIPFLKIIFLNLFR